MERKKVCSVMDCQKLSREACAHAAQNDRLPVQTIVQVLYYEQERLREVKDSSSLSDAPALPSKVNQNTIDIHPVSDELSILRRENQDLKLELVKMKMRLKEMEKSAAKPAVNGPIGITHPSPAKPPLPRKSLISSVSKTLGKFMPQNTKAKEYGLQRPH
ncbi:BTB/POZ domain-containing protein [Forsythia ovata]|uniref:BTB/POZ domain-containing protein n=1 Tax=Forsythia ovata TaxID=205694 RepID=A0ABD1WPN4_9LAMI